MSLQSERDAARLAADVLEILPETATVLRPEDESDGIGGVTQTWEGFAVLPCRLTFLSRAAAEKVLGGAMRDTEYFRIAVPADADVRLTDRLQIGATTYSVEALQYPRSIEIERTLVATRAAL